MISASGAYSRLVSRVPGSSSHEVGQEQVPQALGPRQRLEIAHEGHGVPATLDFLMPLPQARHDVVVHESANPAAQVLDLGGTREIHSLSFRSGASHGAETAGRAADGHHLSDATCQSHRGH
jgi:hypothetical protein